MEYLDQYWSSSRYTNFVDCFALWVWLSVRHKYFCFAIWIDRICKLQFELFKVFLGIFESERVEDVIILMCVLDSECISFCVGCKSHATILNLTSFRCTSVPITSCNFNHTVLFFNDVFILSFTSTVKQCDFASCYIRSLRAHLKTHGGEKPNRCNNCDFASARAPSLRRHMKRKHVFVWLQENFNENEMKYDNRN